MVDIVVVTVAEAATGHSRTLGGGSINRALHDLTGSLRDLERLTLRKDLGATRGIDVSNLIAFAVRELWEDQGQGLKRGRD